MPDGGKGGGRVKGCGVGESRAGVMFENWGEESCENSPVLLDFFFWSQNFLKS